MTSRVLDNETYFNRFNIWCFGKYGIVFFLYIGIVESVELFSFCILALWKIWNCFLLCIDIVENMEQKVNCDGNKTKLYLHDLSSSRQRDVL
jgi:hypothetical protein